MRYAPNVHQEFFRGATTGREAASCVKDREGKRRGRDSLTAYLLPVPDSSNCWNSSRCGHLVNERSAPPTPDWRFPTPQNRHKKTEAADQRPASSKSARTRLFACPIALSKMSCWPSASPVHRCFILVDSLRRSFGELLKRCDRYPRDIPQQQPPRANERGLGALASPTRHQRS